MFLIHYSCARRSGAPKSARSASTQHTLNLENRARRAWRGSCVSERSEQHEPWQRFCQVEAIVGCFLFKTFYYFLFFIVLYSFYLFFFFVLYQVQNLFYSISYKNYYKFLKVLQVYF